MPEEISATEVGKEVSEHAERSGGPGQHARAIAITEAVLLSVVTITAAWSGFAAAKWSTESSLKLATASATRRRRTVPT